MIKYISLTFLFLLISFGLFAQTAEELLQTKVSENSPDIIHKLLEKKLMSKFDTQIMGEYIVGKMEENVKIEDWTFAQLIDSLKVYKQYMNSEVVRYHNYGNDSVYMRSPDGEKHLIGLGEMSVEKLVARESKNLPRDYSDPKLNVRFTSIEQISKIIVDLNLDEDLSMLFGNVILIKLELKENLEMYRIGDFIEIARRVKESKEFRPFLSRE